MPRYRGDRLYVATFVVSGVPFVVGMAFAALGMFDHLLGNYLAAHRHLDRAVWLILASVALGLGGYAVWAGYMIRELAKEA